jgi:hypothetical protein
LRAKVAGVVGFNFPASLVIMLLLFKGSNLGIAQNYPISSYALF